MCVDLLGMRAQGTFAFAHGDDVECDLTIGMWRTSAGIAVTHDINIKGSSGIAIPIRPEHSKNLQLVSMPCISSACAALQDPAAHVPPVYRSLGAQAKSPMFGPLRVIESDDGQKVCILPCAASLVPTTTPDEVAALVLPMLVCITEGLHSAGIEPTRVFGPEYVEGDTPYEFLGNLISACTPRCDILISVMDSGRGRITTLNILSEHEGTQPLCVPALSLTHGDKRTRSVVQHPCIIITNGPFDLILPADAPWCDEAPMEDVLAKPIPLAEFCTMDAVALSSYERQHTIQRAGMEFVFNAVDHMLHGSQPLGVHVLRHPIRIVNLAGSQVPRNTTTMMLRNSEYHSVSEMRYRVKKQQLSRAGFAAGQPMDNAA